MGKCVRIRGSTNPPAATAALCLTLRSGRRVPPVTAPASCSPGTGRPRRNLGPAHRRCCGGSVDKQRACGSTRRSSAAEAGRSPKVLCDDGRQEDDPEAPSSQAVDTGADATVARGVDGRGDSLQRPKTMPLMTDGYGAAAAVNVTERHHGNESRCRGVVAGQTPPKEADLEAFFAAAELAERRRFAEAYNYDVALDRPLEGRFRWEPVST